MPDQHQPSPEDEIRAIAAILLRFSAELRARQWTCGEAWSLAETMRDDIEIYLDYLRKLYPGAFGAEQETADAAKAACVAKWTGERNGSE